MTLPQTQTWNPTEYDARHNFVWRYGAGVLDWLKPQSGERILDLGCGTGHLTERIAVAGAHVIGVDASAEMITAARNTFPNLEWQQVDARDFAFPELFDAVFSNAVLHWILRSDAPQVAHCVARCLKPGSRFVFEMGGQGNIAAIVDALAEAMRAEADREPAIENYFPSLGEYATLLEAAGLSPRRAELFARPTLLEDGPVGMRNWLMTFRTTVLQPLDEATRERVLTRIEGRLRPTLWDGERWTAPYVRLRMLAVKA